MARPSKRWGPPEGQKHHHIISFVCGDGGNYYDVELCTVLVLLVKFIHSEKARKFCEIFTLLLTGTALDKSKVKISQNFVAFSEYMNFK